MTDDAIDWTIRYNATFHTALLRFIVPSIREEGVPAFIVGIGSVSQWYPPPFLTAYAASKEYLSTFIHGLDQEQQFIDPTLDLTFQFMPLGEFVSKANPRSVTYLRPSAQTMARAVISAVGCGHRQVVPYFGHFLGVAFLWIIGRRRGDQFVSQYMVKHYMTDERRARDKQEE